MLPLWEAIENLPLQQFLSSNFNVILMWHLAFIMGVRRGNLSYTSFLTSDYITPPLNQKNMTLYKIFCKFPYWLLTPPVLIFKIEIMNNFRMLCFGNCIVSPSFLDDIFILNANGFFYIILVFDSCISIYNLDLHVNFRWNIFCWQNVIVSTI